MCKKEKAVSCENGIGCQSLSQRVEGPDLGGGAVFLLLFYSTVFTCTFAF